MVSLISLSMSQNVLYKSYMARQITLLYFKKYLRETDILSEKSYNKNPYLMCEIENVVQAPYIILLST
jgi:hypothetical protein